MSGAKQRAIDRMARALHKSEQRWKTWPVQEFEKLEADERLEYQHRAEDLLNAMADIDTMLKASNRTTISVTNDAGERAWKAEQRFVTGLAMNGEPEYKRVLAFGATPVEAILAVNEEARNTTEPIVKLTG